MKNASGRSTAAQEDEEYEIEDILDIKRNKKGYYFLIKWKGYGNSDNTWEPEKNLTYVTSLRKKINQLKRRLQLEEESKRSRSKSAEKEHTSNHIKNEKEKSTKLNKGTKAATNVEEEFKNGSLGSKTSKKKRQTKDSVESKEESRDRKGSSRLSNEKSSSVSQSTSKVSERSKKINKKSNDSGHSSSSKMFRTRNTSSSTVDEINTVTIETFENNELKEDNSRNDEHPFVEDIFSIRIRNNGVQFLASIRNANPQWIDESYIKRVGHLYYKLDDFKRFISRTWRKSKDHKVLIRNMHNIGKKIFVSVGHIINNEEILSLYPLEIVLALYPKELCEFLITKIYPIMNELFN